MRMEEDWQKKVDENEKKNARKFALKPYLKKKKYWKEK